jgi:hypothetical protein
VGLWLTIPSTSLSRMDIWSVEPPLTAWTMLRRLPAQNELLGMFNAGVEVWQASQKIGHVGAGFSDGAHAGNGVSR